MKVALDVSAVPPKIAGAGRYIAEMASRLPSCGVETTLVSRRDDVTRWKKMSPDAHVEGVVPNQRAARLAYEAWVLGTIDIAKSVDLWHGPHYTMPHRGSTPAVVTIHDLTFFTNPEWHERSKVTFFRRAITYSAHHAASLISVSQFTADRLSELVDVRVPVVVAPLGVDFATFSPSSERDDEILSGADLPNDVPFIFFVGTLEPRKGVDVLLSAFEKVASADASVELWIAGQTGWGNEDIEQQLEQHPYRSRIRRLGFISEALLSTLYRRAKVVSYPSRGEGFGLPVLEAMACGALVVTTEETVMADVAGGTAVLVPIGDSEALSAALSDAVALGDTERVARSSKARARAEMFTWEHCVEQHLVAYRQALAT